MTFETPIQPRQFTSLRHFQRISPLTAVRLTGKHDNCKHEIERRYANKRTESVVFKAQPLTLVVQRLRNNVGRQALAHAQYCGPSTSCTIMQDGMLPSSHQ